MEDIIRQFKIDESQIRISPYGEGHINTTLLAETEDFIVQKINTDVFPNVKGLMNNIVGVTEHLSKKGVETFKVIRTKGNKSYLKSKKACYRVYTFIRNSCTFQKVENPEMFKEAGRMFGEFQKYLADYDTSKLTVPIKDFHNTPKRYEHLLATVSLDPKGRAKDCTQEIDFIKKHAKGIDVIINALGDGTIPWRVTHNDTKLNNLLFDKDTKKGLAVIDLDTVMPGSLLFDFGDAIRSGASTCCEDSKEIAKVCIDLELFRAFTEGYLGVLFDCMCKKEIELLPISAFLMTFECGMRFLDDYIDGDKYFKTDYEGHNLVRTRTQLKLVEDILNKLDLMRDIVDKIVSKQQK